MLYFTIYKYTLRTKSNLTHTHRHHVCMELPNRPHPVTHVVLSAWHKQHGNVFRQPPEIFTPLLMGVCLCWGVKRERQADDTPHCILRFIAQLSGYSCSSAASHGPTCGQDTDILRQDDVIKHCFASVVSFCYCLLWFIATWLTS